MVCREKPGLRCVQVNVGRKRAAAGEHHSERTKRTSGSVKSSRDDAYRNSDTAHHMVFTRESAACYVHLISVPAIWRLQGSATFPGAAKAIRTDSSVVRLSEQVRRTPKSHILNILMKAGRKSGGRSASDGEYTIVPVSNKHKPRA